MAKTSDEDLDMLRGDTRVSSSADKSLSPASYWETDKFARLNSTDVRQAQASVQHAYQAQRLRV